MGEQASSNWGKAMTNEAKEVWIIYSPYNTPCDVTLTLDAAKSRAIELFHIPTNDHSWGVNNGGQIGCWNIEGDKVFCKIEKCHLDSIRLHYSQEADL